jgi:hypothetical protein
MKPVMSTLAIVFLISVTAFSAISEKSHINSSVGISGIDAVQVPLKTAMPANANNPEFKEEWQKQHAKEALSALK